MYHLKVSIGEKVEWEQTLDLSMTQIMKRLDTLGVPTIVKYRLKKLGVAEIHYKNGVRKFELKKV